MYFFSAEWKYQFLLRNKCWIEDKKLCLFVNESVHFYIQEQCSKLQEVTFAILCKQTSVHETIDANCLQIASVYCLCKNILLVNRELLSCNAVFWPVLLQRTVFYWFQIILILAGYRLNYLLSLRKSTNVIKKMEMPIKLNGSHG